MVYGERNMGFMYMYMYMYMYIYIYLTFILRGRAGYEMIYNQLGATRLVGYGHFISSKPE